MIKEDIIWVYIPKSGQSIDGSLENVPVIFCDYYSGYQKKDGTYESSSLIWDQKMSRILGTYFCTSGSFLNTNFLHQASN